MKYINEEAMPDQCPPAVAKSENVKDVFRFLEKDVPNAVDFDNHITRNKWYGPESNKCSAIALSFFTTPEKVSAERIRIKKFRKASVVKGDIHEHHGVHSISNFHLNLWVFNGINLFEEFTRKEESNK
ncbi:MAG: hypothetical protein ABS936_07520 [Exiguobacterium indicum]